MEKSFGNYFDICLKMFWIFFFGSLYKIFLLIDLEIVLKFVLLIIFPIYSEIIIQCNRKSPDKLFSSIFCNLFSKSFGNLFGNDFDSCYGNFSSNFFGKSIVNCIANSFNNSLGNNIIFWHFLGNDSRNFINIVLRHFEIPSARIFVSKEIRKEIIGNITDLILLLFHYREISEKNSFPNFLC